MLSPKFFIDTLREQGIDFYAGVPDSLLKNVCAYITDHIEKQHNIITANEGAAVSLAAGYHLSTGKVGMVYMQNSGEGNAINPLASLTDSDVYHIPVLLLIGWRGKPGIHDEPQHVKQGKVTLEMLDVLGIRNVLLSKTEEEAQKQITDAVHYIHETQGVYALVVEKDTFDSYTLQKAETNDLSLSREEAIRIVTAATGPRDVIVSTTGMISRELFELRETLGQGHERDFLTVGSMGHASQIAMGIAIGRPGRRVWCFDGDGAVIMHMGSMAIVAANAPKNYVHVVFNNGAHDSVGGQPTVGLEIDLPGVAKAVGYKEALSVSTQAELEQVLPSLHDMPGPILLEVKVKKGNRKDLGRPTTSPKQNKEALMAFLQQA